MKKLFFLLTFVIAYTPNYSNAQSLALTKTKNFCPTHNNAQAFLCYAKEHLASISDSMFQQGNPKYIWIDLLKDGYIQVDDIRWHNIFITQNNPSPGKAFGNTNIPNNIRKAYAEKWIAFIKHIKEPIEKGDKWTLSLHDGISSRDIANPQSKFRNITVQERHLMGFNARADLALYKELIKDRLIAPDKALDFKLGNSGFFIDGKRLSSEQRHKYINLCKELYGVNYHDRYASLSIGASEENTIGKRIARLEQSIAKAESAVDKN